MKYTVKFKYSAGDTVTLIKFPPYDQLPYQWNHDFKPKKYRVKGYKFTADENGEKIYYQLDAYADGFLRYDNCLSEEYLDGKGTEHTEELDFSGIRNQDIRFGDTVYACIYYGTKDRHYVWPYLTFARKGTVLSFVYKNEISFLNNGDKIERPSFSTVCSFYRPDGWSVTHAEFSWGILRDLDDDFVTDYIVGCKKHRFPPRQIENDKNCLEWLKEMGIYEKVRKLYDKVTLNKGEMKPSKVKDTEKKTMAKSSSKQKVSEEVKDMLAGMSDEMKAELLKQLKKK